MRFLTTRRVQCEARHIGPRKTRVALVIGNADYRYGGGLANPVNEATDFADVLRQFGFDVIEERNLHRRGMEEKIAESARKLDKAGIALFFYASHAVQVDVAHSSRCAIEGGDLRPERAAILNTAAINIGQVLSQMEAEQRANLAFLDASRDNPKAARPTRADDQSPGRRAKNRGRGLRHWGVANPSRLCTLARLLQAFYTIRSERAVMEQCTAARF